MMKIHQEQLNYAKKNKNRLDDKKRNKLTPLKTRLISNNQQMLRYDKEIVQRSTEEDEVEILRTITSLVNDFNVRAVVISDYNKGLITRKLLKEIIELSIKSKIFTLCDPKGCDAEKYKG